jgi:hypothetical protein
MTLKMKNPIGHSAPTPSALRASRGSPLGQTGHQQPVLPTSSEPCDPGESLSMRRACDVCKKAISGRGRYVYCASCEKVRRHEIETTAADNLRFRRRCELGENAYRALESRQKFLYRLKSETNRRHFLGGGIRSILLETYLERSPLNPRRREETTLQDFITATNLMEQSRESEAADLAKTIRIAQILQPGPNSRRVIRDCEDLIIDCGLAVNGDFSSAVDRLGHACDQSICAWREQDEPFRFVKSLLRNANFLRAYHPDRYSEARELLKAVGSILSPKATNNRTILMLKREQAHREFQLDISADKTSAAEEGLKRLRDLSLSVGTPAAIVDGVLLEATYYYRKGWSGRAWDCLNQARSEASKSIPRPTLWSLLRVELEFCIAEGGGTDAEPLIDRFVDLWKEHPCMYQWNRISKWRPEQSLTDLTKQPVIRACLPALTDLNI